MIKKMCVIFLSFSFFFKKYVTNSNIDLRLRTLFDRILQLLSSTQPPETATGATLVQCLAQLNLENLSELINLDQNKEFFDQIYLLIHYITKRLDNEVKQANINLFQAAKNGPMYGCLSGINALLSIIQGDKYIKRRIFIRKKYKI